MEWTIEEIRRQTSIHFDEVFHDIEPIIKSRDPAVLGLSSVHVVGDVKAEAELILLEFAATYVLTLPSSRSLAPVELPTRIHISETYSDADLEDPEFNDEEFFPLDDQTLSLDESLTDSIILEKPTQVLTEEEEKSNSFPSGQGWQVLSEEAYAEQKLREKLENSPFGVLRESFGN
jgi:uncharacterized protein